MLRYAWITASGLFRIGYLEVVDYTYQVMLATLKSYGAQRFNNACGIVSIL